MSDEDRPRHHEGRRRTDADSIESGAWLYNTLQNVREELLEGHRRLRQDMSDGFEKLGQKMDRHAEDDDAVERRVFKMETETLFRKDSAHKRSAWISLGISTGTVGLWKVLDWWIKKP